jgi:hypothetical protein
LDCECEAQTINQFTHVDGPDAAAWGLNYGEIQNHRQSSAIESNYISEIGKICLTSETDPKVLAENFVNFSESSYHEGNNISSGDKFSGTEDWYYGQINKLSADDFTILSHHNNPETYYHVHSDGPREREFIFIHGKILYCVGMKQSKVGVFNQIGFAVVEVSQTSKQKIELSLNRGKLFYTKNGMFGINESSYYQFDPEIIKLAPATYSQMIKPNPTFST